MSILSQTKIRKIQWGKMLRELMYFPILILYLEMIFHLYMGLKMEYLFSFGSLSIAIGLIFGSICMLFPWKVNRVLKALLTFLLSVLYCVEMICKDILQQYYQLLSAMDTAADNHLDDYWSAIKASLIKNWFGLVLMLVVPAVVSGIYIFRATPLKKKKYSTLKQFFALIPVCLSVYMASLGAVLYYPWEGDFTPSNLYYTDTKTDDQVEQLGVVTMLRLDIKHTIWGTPTGKSISLENLNQEEIIIEEKEEEVVYLPNIMEVDLQTIIDTASNDDVKWLSEYINTVSPTMQNEYTGMFEGYNVIFITAEGFSGYMIDETLTPTLYKLANEGFVFENFYSALHFTSTSGGEFQNLTGLYPKDGFPISMKETGVQGTYLPFTLANELNGEGYTSIGYHFNENMYGRDLSHPNLGYEWRQASDCLNPVIKETTETGKVYWPQSDDYMIEQTIEDYIGQEPFNIYYMSLSGHLPYGIGSNQMSARNWTEVENLPYSEKTKAYLAANLELEKGLTRLITELEEAGIAEQTLIVLSPDHIPYSDLDILEELAGKTFGSDSLENLNEESVDFDVYRNSLIIWSASMEEPVRVEKNCCQVDILPTLLNLLGVEYDSRMLAGTDILSDSEGLVIFSSNSWLTDKGLYNRFTREFTLAEDATMSAEEIEQYVESTKTKVSCRLAMTSIIIENDYYSLVFEK